MPFSKKRGENECSICGCVKLPDEFYLITKRGKQKRSERCKQCCKTLGAEDRKNRKDKIKAAAAMNRESIAIYQREYRLKNAERLQRFYAARYLEQKAKKPARVFKTKEEKALKKKNRLNQPSNKIKSRIHHRLFICLRDFGNGSKAGRGLSYVGCSIPELKNHLESQFKKGMNWGNHSKTGWHIDHIIPCSSFDHSDEKQLRQCWHFTNMRPMWAKQNMSKGAKITAPQMSLLL